MAKSNETVNMKELAHLWAARNVDKINQNHQSAVIPYKF